MPDFTRPMIRLHTVNIREQFVAPLMNGKLKAITRLNGRGYNTGDCIRFSVLPMQSSDVQFSMLPKASAKRSKIGSTRSRSSCTARG